MEELSYLPFDEPNDPVALFEPYYLKLDPVALFEPYYLKLDATIKDMKAMLAAEQQRLNEEQKEAEAQRIIRRARRGCQKRI